MLSSVSVHVEGKKAYLDFDLVEDFAVVDTDDRSDHFWNDDHVSQVGLHGRWLRTVFTDDLLLGLAQSLDQRHRLRLQTSLESATGTRIDELRQVLRAEVEQRLELNASVGELSERPLLLRLLFVSLKCKAN